MTACCSACNRQKSRAGYRLILVMLFVFSVCWPGIAVASEKLKPFETIATIDSSLHQTVPLAGKVVYVDFWASWCQPCRLSFPWMAQMAKKYGERGFQIVTINLDRDHAAAEKFLKEVGAEFKVVFDSTGSIAKMFKVDVMPTSFLYGRDGTLLNRFEGFHKDESAGIDSLINNLVNASEKKKNE